MAMVYLQDLRERRFAGQFTRNVRGGDGFKNGRRDTGYSRDEAWHPNTSCRRRMAREGDGRCRDVLFAIRMHHRPRCAFNLQTARCDARQMVVTEEDMVTTVGTESTLSDLVEDLLLLEHDAIAAYEQTIASLQNADYKAKVEEFKHDHDRHVQELTSLAQQLGATVHREGDMKQMLTTGKVKMASLIGDRTVLGAMRTNEEDTVTAYERACGFHDLPADASAIFQRAHADEVRHRAWMADAANG